MQGQKTIYRCAKCGLTFGDMEALLDHRDTHDVPSEAARRAGSKAQGEYAHYDDVLRRARYPVFGASMIFLVLSAVLYAESATIGYLFAPVFVAVSVMIILTVGFLMRYFV